MLPTCSARPLPAPVATLPLRSTTSLLFVQATAADGALRRATAYYSNNMFVRLIETYGQVKVAARDTGRPLARAYIKVYWQRKGASGNAGAKFYKDGYTDLRGRFDYASISTDELSQVGRFAILVSSRTHGAVVREATPPKQ